MKKLCVICLLLLGSCGQSRSPQHTKAPFNAYQKIINFDKTSKDSNLNSDIALSNKKYPMAVSLYEDGTWYYDLPTLGDGHGTWKFVDGRLELVAKRNLFDMKIDVLSEDEAASELSLSFIDRFGPQRIKVQILNLK